jgi:hypothetical protein
MSEIQFLLDENVDPDFLAALWQAWPAINVRRIVFVTRHPTARPIPTFWHGAKPISSRSSRTIIHHAITCKNLAAGHHVPGIFILNDRITPARPWRPCSKSGCRASLSDTWIR